MACGPNADLAKVVAAWPALPDAIRRAVLAIVETSLPAAPPPPSALPDATDSLHPGYERLG